MLFEIVLSSIFVLIFLLLFFYVFQEKFIFRNGKKLKRNHPFNFTTNFEEVFLKTNDQKEINAIHLKLPAPKGVILFFHGNKGNLEKWGKRTSNFLSYNYEVFIIDYRNYGKSTGNFNEEKMYEDALLAYDHLKNKYSENKIVVYGFSLGCTFAIKVASEKNPKELILEAPFFNLKKATQKFMAFAPTFLLKFSFHSDLDIPLVKSPITIFHGNQDNTTSFKASQELLSLNPATKNKFVAIDGGTHHNITSFSIYKQKLKELLER